MKKMKKLLPALGSLLIVLTIGLTWTSCEKETDDAKVYVWIWDIERQPDGKFKTIYKLYGDCDLLQKYEYTDNSTSYYMIGRDNELRKGVVDTVKGELHIYQNKKLILTCRYDTVNDGCKVTGSYHKLETGNYVLGSSRDHENAFQKLILWKNGTIIWSSTQVSGWYGIGNIGNDLYWLVRNRNSHEYLLYRNGELLKTYEFERTAYLYMEIIDEDIYLFNTYSPSQVWRNDELIFGKNIKENSTIDLEQGGSVYLEQLKQFDGDLYLAGTVSGSIDYSVGRIWKNGEILYNIAYPRTTSEWYPYYLVEMEGVYKHHSNIYSWGTIRVMDEGNEQPTYQTIWKNGERLFSYPLNTGQIFSVFKK